MGFVGLTLAAKLSQYRQVIGLEVNSAVREVINEGRAHFFEPGLDDVISSSIESGRLVITGSSKSIPSTVKDIVITVGTPLKAGEIDLSYIDAAVEEVSEFVSDDSCVILRSTVALGVTRARVLEVFQSRGKFPMVAMCPERTVEGKALFELEELPQVIGASSEDALKRASELFSILGCPIHAVSSLEAAESVKLITNTFRDLTFAFANEVALFSQETNLDARELIAASNEGYPRSTIPKPGLTGGPCLEKDPWIFASSGQKHGVDLAITKAARRTHESVIPRTLSRLVDSYNSLPDGPNGILVAGLAFKGRPATNDVRGSLAKNLADKLAIAVPAANLFWFDPLVSESDAIKMGFVGGGNLEEHMEKSRLLVIQHNSEELLRKLQAFFRENKDWPGHIFDYTGELDLGPSGSHRIDRLGMGPAS